MKKIYLSILISLLFSVQAFSQCRVRGRVTAPSCVGLCNGRITVTAFGGTAPYTYLWSPGGATTAAIADLCPGTYKVTVKDARTCDVVDSFVVAAPAPLAVTTTVVNVRCFGGATGSATSDVSGGGAPYTYSWNTNPVQTTRTARNLAPGTYTVIVSAGGGACTATATATVLEPTQLVATTGSTISACGSPTGSVSVSVSGGTGPYTYSWSTTPVSTTSSVTGLASGTYTVTVRDANGCTITDTAAVGNSSGLSATASHTNVTCFGDGNGTAIILPSGGKTPYTYSWSTTPLQAKDTATGLVPGNYTGIVTDSSGCTFAVKVTITQPTEIIVTARGTNVSCFGDTNGTATARVRGGLAPYSFSWSTTPVQTTATATKLAAGIYTVVVTDANSCTATATATVTAPATKLSVSITSTNVICYGAGNGTATATGSGGTAPYTYLWSDNRRTGMIRGLGIGTYIVTVTDRGGCTAVDSVTITRPPQIIIATNSVAATCGVANGDASATITGGGVSPFAYHWSSGQTTAIATGIPAGVYIVTVTDSNGCSSTASAVVPNTGAGTATITASTNVKCRGGATGTAIVSMNGGTAPYTYSWSTTPVQTKDTAIDLRAGTYGVTVTDSSGCIAAATVTITQPGTIVTSSATHTNVSCNGDSTGTATVNPAGGTPPYTYSWNSTPVQTTQTAVNLKAITYIVTVTDANGCTSTSTARLTQPTAMVLTTTTGNVTCNGGSNGDATVTATGGIAPYTYSWSTTPVQTLRTASGLSAETYTVTVTESTGCSATKTVTITQPIVITLNTSTTDATCGQTNGTASVNITSGGTGPFTYSWSPSGQTTGTATGLATNVYTATVTDSKGCSATATAIVASSSAATATINVKNVTCYGQSNGAASITLSGGTPPFTYAWTTTPIQTTDTATGLAAGSYGIVATDHSGCLTAGNAVVGQPDSMTAVNTVTNVSCFNDSTGSASAVISGGNDGYTYNWNTTPVQTTDTATGLSAASDTLTVTDSKGCILIDAVTISQPSQALDVSAAQTQQTCNNFNNGVAIANVSGGTAPYTYSWNSNPVQTTDTATGLATGAYIVTVTDSLGCFNSATAHISTATAITATTAKIDVTCFGYANGSASVNATGGTPPYSYSWNSNPVQNTDTAITLIEGIYTVTVTDMNGCSATFSDTIRQPEAAVTLSIIPTNASCGNSNGKAIASVQGGTYPYTYSWNTLPVQTTDTATGLGAGDYIVTVTDANGCMNSDQTTINNSSSGRDSVTAVTNVSCYGGSNGSATVTVIGGGTPPFSYSWNPSGQTAGTATNLAANSYIVTVTDSNGCITSTNVFISQPAPVVLIPFTTGVSCFGVADGVASVIISGGNAPYTYSWSTSPVQTNDTAINLAFGTYTVTVTDSGGCMGTATATINQPPPLTATAFQTPVFCNGGSDGTGTVIPVGGTFPYSYSWLTNPVQDSSTAIGLTAGIYTVTVTDFNGCVVTVPDTIRQPKPIYLGITSTKTSTCGTSNGTATVTVDSGGVFPFTYLWSPTGATTPNDSNLSAGFYEVVVTDANGCSDSTGIAVNSIGAGNANVITFPDSCNGGNDGYAFVTMIGGTQPFTYIWTTIPEQTTDTAIDLSAGSYYVSVYDHAGCVTDAAVIITQPDPITYTASAVYATCLSCADGYATIQNPDGGTPPYTYIWITAPVQVTQTATNLLPGVYNFCITDANNCSICDSITIGISAVGIINLAPLSDSKLIVYPNPTSGQFTLEFQNVESQDVVVRITSLIGQEIYTERINETNHFTKTYNLSDYPKDIYLIQIIGNKNVYTGRIILE